MAKIEWPWIIEYIPKQILEGHEQEKAETIFEELNLNEFTIRQWWHNIHLLLYIEMHLKWRNNMFYWVNLLLKSPPDCNGIFLSFKSFHFSF